MTQLHKHLNDFVKHSDYIGGYMQPIERMVNTVAFEVIDRAVIDFMHRHFCSQRPCVLPVKQYNSEENAGNANHHEILNDLSLLRDKSTMLNQELKFSYYIPTTDPNSADLYGIDVRMQFYLLPPDTVQGALNADGQGPGAATAISPEKKGYFSKMVVIHIDELEDYDFILG